MTARTSISAAVAIAVSSVVLTIIGRSHSWDAGVSLGVAGLVISIGGFGVALAEIARAATRAEATLSVMTETLAGVAASRLAVLITQLRQLIIDLEEAVSAGDSRHSRMHLNQWRYISQDAEGLITRRFSAGHPVIPLLRKSLRATSQAKASLFTAGTTPAAACKGALTAMERVADELGPLLEELLPLTTGGTTND